MESVVKYHWDKDSVVRTLSSLIFLSMNALFYLILSMNRNCLTYNWTYLKDGIIYTHNYFYLQNLRFVTLSRVFFLQTVCFIFGGLSRPRGLLSLHPRREVPIYLPYLCIPSGGISTKTKDVKVNGCQLVLSFIMYLSRFLFRKY